MSDNGGVAVGLLSYETLVHAVAGAVVSWAAFSHKIPLRLLLIYFCCLDSRCLEYFEMYLRSVDMSLHNPTLISYFYFTG